MHFKRPRVSMAGAVREHGGSVSRHAGAPHGDADRFTMQLVGLYFVIDAATVVYLTFFDGFVYNWWNWLLEVPLNAVLGAIWPIYWLLLRPLLGG